jgi:hypothetical protein
MVCVDRNYMCQGCSCVCVCVCVFVCVFVCVLLLLSLIKKVFSVTQCSFYSFFYNARCISIHIIIFETIHHIRMEAIHHVRIEHLFQSNTLITIDVDD